MTKFNLRSFLSFFFTVFVFLPLAWSQSLQERSRDLLNLPKRPTIAQVSEVLKLQGMPASDYSQLINFFPEVDYDAVGGSLLSAFQSDFSKVVAQLEYAFPGAVFLGLGRDSAILVDALDAFYSHLGQAGRSKLIEASGNSFSQNPSDETIVKFLANYGLDLDKLEQSRPIVIFDGTRYNTNSQSRVIMAAIYRVAASKGIDPKKLVKKSELHQHLLQRLSILSKESHHFDSRK